MFTFQPIFKEVIWGGTDILPYKGFPADTRKIGESWELSHVRQNFSIVANGAYAGKSIDDLINEYGERLLGAHVIEKFAHTFPLLIKFIDARDNLSIQVHPNDQLAQARHQSFGKTEMWYVVKATPEAVLYSGFAKQIDADEYVRRIENDSLLEILQKFHVKAGDVFFLPAGRVHAIGSGCFIAEIQQTSDFTYRIYDYNRKDANGKTRELHTEWAKDAIDYTLYPNYRTSPIPTENEPTKLVQCSYFTTNLLQLTQTKQRDFSSIDSFTVYVCIEGKAILNDNKGNTLSVQQGQTILIPADTAYLTIEPLLPSKFLETYLE
jgi:mannose-6-phosphate isomerase